MRHRKGIYDRELENSDLREIGKEIWPGYEFGRNYGRYRSRKNYDSRKFYNSEDICIGFRN